MRNGCINWTFWEKFTFMFLWTKSAFAYDQHKEKRESSTNVVYQHTEWKKGNRCTDMVFGYYSGWMGYLHMQKGLFIILRQYWNYWILRIFFTLLFKNAKISIFKIDTFLYPTNSISCRYFTYHMLQENCCIIMTFAIKIFKLRFVGDFKKYYYINSIYSNSIILSR